MESIAAELLGSRLTKPLLDEVTSSLILEFWFQPSIMTDLLVTGAIYTHINSIVESADLTPIGVV